MTVKTGQAWAGTFVTLDSTGALEAGSPSGVLYVDGVADGATVTITGSNPYKWSVTLPSLTAGQRVDMYITATISTIATAGIVASEQADTALVSEVKAETASILADTGTDGVKLADDAITAGKFDESTAFPLKSADTGATALARTGADSDTLETLSDQMDAIKTETASILEDTGTTIPGTITTIDNEVAVIDGIVDAILADTSTDGVPLTAAAIDAILDEVVIGTYTVRQLLKVISSALAGKVSGGGTSTLTFRSVDDTVNTIVAEVGTSGNRTSVTLTV